MKAPPRLTSTLLAAPGVSHGFFSRTRGVSKGLYASLNTGVGSRDEPENVAENRRRCAFAIGVTADRLFTNHQIHSADVAVVNEPQYSAPAKADGLATNRPGLALGILAADCMPWLFIDPDARVIGAAHGGWRGALAGILENTITAMETLGAEPARIRAALGPCLRQPNFEVGVDLTDAFTAKHPAASRFFSPGRTPGKRQLDLAGFAAWRLAETGVVRIDDLGVCTLAAPELYFSYRASQRTGETDYGRNLSAITLT